MTPQQIVAVFLVLRPGQEFYMPDSYNKNCVQWYGDVEPITNEEFSAKYVELYG